MNSKLTKLLTNTKLALTIAGTAVGVLFFFFSLKTDIVANSKEIKANSSLLMKTTEYQEKTLELLHETNTNVKLLQKDLDYIRKEIDSK